MRGISLFKALSTTFTGFFKGKTELVDRFSIRAIIKQNQCFLFTEQSENAPKVKNRNRLSSK